MKRFKLGFTLAEVLITLSIIGVISALTLPSLTINHKKNVTTAQVKRVVNRILNAQVMAEANGKYLDLIDDDSLADVFLSQLPVQTRCLNGEDSCGLTTFKTLHRGDAGLALDPDVHRYMLTDGTYMAFVDESTENSPRFTIYFDINGSDGPDVMGHDVFALLFAKDENTGNYRPFTAPADYEGRFKKDGYGCKGNSEEGVTTNGKYCLWRIMTDGYKINYW